MSYNIAYILKKNRIVDSNAIRALANDFFLDGFQLDNFYNNLGKDSIKPYKPVDHPKNTAGKYTLDTLRERIRLGLEAKLIDVDRKTITQEKKDLIMEEIGALIDDYDKKTQSYWNWFKLLTDGDASERFLRKKGTNTDFILGIIFSNDILPQLQYKGDLVKLFLSDVRASNFEARFLGETNPRLSSLLFTKFIVSKWTKGDFEALSQKVSARTNVDMTRQDLEQVKKMVIKKFDDFIKSRGYIADDFTRFGIRYTQNEILPEFNLVESLFNFATERKHSTQIREELITNTKIVQSLSNVEDYFGVGNGLLRKSYRDGVFISNEIVETIISSILQEFQEDFGHISLLSDEELQGVTTDQENNLLEKYSDILAETASYAAQRGLSLFTPSRTNILNQYDLGKWEDERVKGYTVVFHLCQFLGFDPLFFQSLDKEIFTNAKWQRQHFRDSIFRRTSSRVSDVLLTDKIKHNTYEQFSEGFVVAIMNSLIEAIQLKKDAITPADLRNSLDKHMKKYLTDQGGTTPEGNSVGELADKVWRIWTQDGNVKFKSRLDDLNERRTKYISKTTGQFMYSAFLEGEYDMDANSRFVKNARDLHILLRNDQISGSGRDLYALPHEYRYMQKIFPVRGSIQTQITDFMFMFTSDSAGNINIDWINYLERQVWKI